MPSPFKLAGLLILGVSVSIGTACGSDVTDPERRGGALPDLSEGGAAGAASGGPIAFCDALAVVRAKCQRCHGEPLHNAAPVPFLDYDDFFEPYGSSNHTYGDIAVGVVERDVMPYVALNDGPSPIMPPVQPLTAPEKATLLGWLKQGLRPEGGTDCP